MNGLTGLGKSKRYLWAAAGSAKIASMSTSESTASRERETCAVEACQLHEKTMSNASRTLMIIGILDRNRIVTVYLPMLAATWRENKAHFKSKVGASIWDGQSVTLCTDSEILDGSFVL